MNQSARFPAVTLAAASNADLIFANRVASAVEERLAMAVTVVEAKSLSRRQSFTALVSAVSASRLRSLLKTLDFDKTVQIKSDRRSVALIHPQPEAAHYELAASLGLGDVIRWPQGSDGWLQSLVRTINVATEDEPSSVSDPTASLLGDSEAMRQIRRQILRIALFDTNVLITGETGSGKECVAQALHQASRRRNNPLVNLNCAALPDSLIESELFGYERGAFTGASASYPGKFGLAEGGTLFLDEIGEMPPTAQAKILRAIETREYYRLGGTRIHKADVRLIAATHRNLESLCASREFRLDLYFRLNIARVELPALRDRADDILPLARYFIQQICGQMRRRPVSLSEAAAAVLRAYTWPGNVRELRSVVEAALINTDGHCIQEEDLPAQLHRWSASNRQPVDERSQLISTLERTRWNKTEAARELRWSRMKLYRKLKQFGLDTE